MTDLERALLNLDREDDSHWTAEGYPRVDVVASMVGRPVTREELTHAAPTFTRRDAGRVAETEASLDAEQEVECEVPDVDPGVMIDLAHVDVHDDVVTMDTREVFGSIDLVRRAIEEFARQDAELSRRLSVIKDKREDIGRRTALLERALGRMAPREDSRVRIARYQEVQRRNREERAKRAKAFVDAGTSRDDVIDEMDPRSRVDRALASRKPARSRPQFSGRRRG